MERRLKGTLLLVVVLVQALIYTSPITTAEGSNWVLEGYSFKSSAGGSVYPGSRNTRLIITLRYVGNEDALNPTACIVPLHWGFQVVGPACSAGRDADGDALHVVKPGNTTYFTYTLNVEKTVSPGRYYAALNVSYYNVSSNKLVWELLYLNLEVSPYPSLNVTVKDTYFTPYSYPGACPVYVVTGVENGGPTAIVNMRLVLEMPGELADPSKLNYTYVGSIDPGGEVYLNLGATCISPSASANSTYGGVLYISAQLVTDDGVLYTDERYYNVTFALEDLPGMKIRILDYELTSGSSLPGFKNTGLRILVRSEEPGTLELSYSYLVLENAVTGNDSLTATYTHETLLDYLESTWITYSGINVMDNATYVKANITIHGSVLREGVRYPALVNLVIVVPLHYRDLDIKVERVVWRLGYAHPGSAGNSLMVTILNSEVGLSITDAVVDLVAPKDALYPDRLTVYNVVFNPGSLVELSFNDIAIPSSVMPGAYEVIINITGILRARDNSFRYISLTRRATVVIEDRADVKIRVVGYELTSGSSLPGFKNTGLRILVRSEEPGTLRITYSVAVFENALTVNGSAIATYAHNIALNYLESAWITYSGIDTVDGAMCIKVNITIYGSVLHDGAEYAISTNLLVIVKLEERDIGVLVERAAWADGYAYPGSTGNTLVLTLLNNESDFSVADATVEVTAPGGVLYPDRLVTYNVAFSPGSLVEVRFTDIIIPSTVKPGVYELTVSISGVLRARDGSFKYVRIARNTTTTIADPSKLELVLPVISVADIFWGEGTPQYVYPGNARTPLTVVLQNRGTVPAYNVLVFIDGISPGDVEVLNGAAQCGVQVPPGSTCVAVFYLNLSSSVSGLKSISFVVNYTVQGLGTNTVFTQPLTATILLPEYAAGAGLVIADYGWLNNNPVFPRTRGAVVSITLANLEPYTVYSIWVYMKTPPCMNMGRGSSGSAYIAGPLATLQTTTVSFTLDLDNCAVGSHPATIEMDYYLQTGGGGTRKRVSQSIRLLVESDENSIEYLMSGWLNTPPSPPVYGAQYYIVFRNNAFPRISNPVLKLHLPQGVVESKTNSSLAVALPAYRLTAQQAYLLLQGAPGNVAQLISQYLSQQPVAQSTGKGDFILYVVSLNIEKVGVTEFMVPYTITFIDHWDGEYSVAANFTVKMLSAPPLVEIYPATPLAVFRNGTAILDVIVENRYNAPISNLYVALMPASSNVIPQGAVKYVEKLEAYSNVVLRYELVYNPVQITVGSVPMTMSSAVFTATLIYMDITGGLHTMNTTLATMIAPFIELTIMPGTFARYSKNTLSVNGIIANTGISGARSVVVYLRYGDVEAINILGDVDPASQTPFRIEVQAPYNGDNCTLVVKYRDEYGSEYTLEKTIGVMFVPEKTETAPPVQQPQVDVFRLAVVALVAAFLGGAIYIIYRHVKRTTKQGVYNEVK
ncbi:MAG: hypothetical protein QXJ84_06015 [Desulfurococcaceae archaeon]